MKEKNRLFIMFIYLIINLYYIDGYIVWLYRLRQTLKKNDLQIRM